jgi:hypothetical protein
MNLPRRRRGRPRGTPRPAAVNDTRAAGQWLDQMGISTGPADGTTWPPPSGPAAVIFEGHDTEPLASYRGQPRYTPPTVLPMPQARAVMKVYPPGPGVPAPTSPALEVVRYLHAKVIILRKRGHLDRITDDKLAMLPADRIRNRRTTARLIVDEAAELLRCGGEQR